MSNKIFEDAPQLSGGAADKIKKAARQLAYDVRYKVKGQFKDGQKTDAASLKRAYMQQLGKSPAPGPVKALAKKMLIGEQNDFVNISEMAKSSTSNAYMAVFVNGFDNIKKESVDLEEESNTKYTVRVTDKTTKKSYLRKASRAKISELRKNPNISSVEITGRSQEDTYDKTGTKAKKDYDGDGKVESGSKEHAGAVHNAIQRKKGGVADGQDTRKEEVIYEKEDKGEKKIDVMKGKNKVIINPKLGEQVEGSDSSSSRVSQIKLKISKEREKLAREEGKTIRKQQNEEMGGVRYCPKCDKDETRDECKYGGEYWDENSKPAKAVDSRAVPTMVNLVKNKMRARGLNMSYDMEGNSIDENSKKTPYGAKADKAVASVRDQLAKYSDEKLKKIRSQNKKPAPIGVKEAAEDRLRDFRQERGGVDGNKRYDRPPARKATNKELGIRDFTSAEKAKREKEIRAHLKKMRR